MSVTLAFMTNYTLYLPDTDKQEQTIKSFFNVLKPLNLVDIFILCDEKPLSKVDSGITLYNGNICDDYKILGDEYENKLKNIDEFKDATIIKTDGLCDGYKKVIELCKTPYLFFLEHDWEFLSNIKHTLVDLTKLMDQQHEINAILFNKLWNTQQGHRQTLYKTSYNIPLCLTNRQSNNPYLLRVEHARNCRVKMIDNNGCSVHQGVEYNYVLNNIKLPNYCGGIECELTEFCNKDTDNFKILGTYIYGCLDGPPTIKHTDGCDRDFLTKYIDLK